MSQLDLTVPQDPLNLELDEQYEAPPEKVNVFQDTVLGVVRGGLGLVQSTYDLADYIGDKATGGILDLPDVDLKFGLGESKTWQGQVAQGVSQFLIGFGPLLGALKVASASAKLGKAGKALLGGGTRRGFVAGGITDFVGFASHEARLSNLIKSHTELESPILDYLASDEDEGFLEGRLKNALEGVILGAGAEAVVRGLAKGLRVIKEARKIRNGIEDPSELIPELLKRPDLLDEEGFIGPVREIDQIDSSASSVVDEPVDAIDEVAPEDATSTATDDIVDEDAAKADDVTEEPLEPKAVEVEESTAIVPVEENDYFTVTDDLSKDVKFSNEVNEDELDTVARQIAEAMIGRGDRVRLDLPSDKFGLMQRVNKYIQEKEPIRPQSETTAEHVASASAYLPDMVNREYAKKLVGADIDTLNHIRRRVTAFRMIADDIMRDMTRVIKDEAGTLGIERKRAIVTRYLEDLYEFSALESQVARQFGKGLQQTKAFRNTRSKINIDDIRGGSRENASAATRGRAEAIADDVIALIEDGATTDEVTAQVLGLATKSKGAFFRMTREFLLNNLLSAVPTMAVNTAGGVMTLVLDTFEKSVGSLIAGDPQMAKLAIKHTWDVVTTAEAYKLAGKSYKKGPILLGDASTPFAEANMKKELTAQALNQNFGARLDKEWSARIDKVFEIFRTPTKVLTTTDELFKQFNARRAALYKASIEAIDNGVTDPKAITQFAYEKLNSIIRGSGEIYSEEALYRQGVNIARSRGWENDDDIHRVAMAHAKQQFDENASGLANYSKDTANELAFTKDLEKDKITTDFYNFLNKHPVTSFVIPFFRTPVNIMKYSFERTPFSVANISGMKQLSADLFGDDAIVKRAAIGRLATTASATATLVAMMHRTNQEDNFYISGGGPLDPDRRKRLEETGWQKYSIKVGDKWYSYQRLDPFATIIGVLADMNELIVHQEYSDVTQSMWERVSMGLVTMIQRNIVNKSYLAGIEQFTAAISDTGGSKIERWLGATTSNFFPWSSMMRTTVGGVTGAIAGDHEIKQIRSFADYWLRTVPVAQNRLDPKRNLLGEVREYGAGNWYRAFSPLPISADDDDQVLQEIANLDHGFTQPSPSFNGLIDLTDYRNNKGQSAHDRRMELMSTVRVNGKTLRQALTKVINSSKYQKFSPRSEPGLTSPRVKLLNRVLTQYRAKAMDQMLNEYPELSNFKRDYDMAKEQQRRGVALDNLIQTLEF